MNLWFRFLWILFSSRFQSKLNYLDKCRTRFRVWPTDLDILGHMNNGKYFSLMDLARVNLIIRSGIGKAWRDDGYFPVLSGEIIRFKKSLKLFRAFDIETRAIGWDEKNFYLEQYFIRNEKIYSHSIISARILDKKGNKISPADSIKSLAVNPTSPIFPDYLNQWIALSEKL